MIFSRLGASALARKLNLRLAHPAGTVRLQHVLEQFPAAAFLINTGSGRIITANARAARLTEWTRAELVERSIAEVFAAPRARDTLPLVYSLEPGAARHEADVPLRTRSGRVVFVDLGLAAFEDAGGRSVLATASVVEERLSQSREVARQLHALRAIDDLLTLFASPTENALEPAVRLTREMTGADAAGFYAFTSVPGLALRFQDGVPAAFPRQVGPTEIQYLTAPLHWVSGQRPESYLQQAAMNAGWAQFLAHPVGSAPASVGLLFVAYRAGSPAPPQAPALLGIAARQTYHLVSLSVHESRLAEAQELARRLSNRLAAVNTQIDEGVVLLSADGTVEELNRAAARLLGWRSEDVTGLPVSEVLVGARGTDEAIRRGVGGESVDPLETHLHHRSGQAFPVQLQLRPLPEGGAVLTVRDLSEAKASQKRQQDLTHLADAAEAMQSFAHEIRNPLNAIATGVQYVASKLAADSPAQTDLAKIHAESRRTSTLMNDLLAYAKPTDPQFASLDLEALLRRLLQRYTAKMQRGNIQLSFSAEPCPPVWADAQLVERVFLNLFDNALQAMTAGGHLSLHMRTVQVVQGCSVETQVCDTGPGIPADTVRRIFTPYFTTKADGTGLGLAICKRLVSLNRGAIDCASFPVGGTIFKVTLPAQTDCDEEIDNP